MQIPAIPSLPRNSDDFQLRVHPTRACRLVDHVTGSCPTRPCRAPAGGAIANQLGAKLNERPQELTPIILPNIYTETR
jgi:hypothetical protein